MRPAQVAPAHEALSAAAGRDRSATYRPDLDGLRALAVGLVVVYHVWFDRVSGGVDVFLLLSAYFLTGALLRRVDAGSGVRLVTFWTRRFWRLVPAAGVTLCGVLLAAYYVFPPSMWQTIWSQTLASLFYVENIELQRQNVDYYDRGSTVVSPLQHFWSLSIQGQVFLLWPVLFLAVVALARVLRLPLRRTLVVAFATVGGASFVYALRATSLDQTAAYFSMPARLWEFSLGAIAAILVARVRLPRAVAVVLGTAGVIGIVTCGLMLDAAASFPGVATLWPTLSTVAVIAAGAASPGAGILRTLSRRSWRRIGAVSYGLYLVHWPVLITWRQVEHVERLDFVSGLVVITISVALAFALHYGVERPLRSWQRIRGTRMTVLALVAVAAMVVTPVVAWRAVEEQRASSLAALDAHPGAAAADLAIPVAYEPNTALPTGTMLAGEWASLEGRCAGEWRATSPLLLEQCFETRGTAPDAPVMLVIGDSHAQQWMAAVVPGALAHGYTVIALLRGGCSFAADEAPVAADGCLEWRTDAEGYIAQKRPDVVVMVGTRSFPDSPEERPLDGLEETVAAVQEAGARAVVIRDTPRFSEDMFACVETNGPAGCARDRSQVLATEEPLKGADLGDAIRIDLTGFFCPNDTCEAVIGNVVVYIDDNHPSLTYMTSLAPFMESALAESGLWQR